MRKLLLLIGLIGLTSCTRNAAKIDFVMEDCNAAPINVAVTCGGISGIRVDGFNWLTLDLDYTRSAGSGYEFFLETCREGYGVNDCTDATDWRIVASQAATVGTAVAISGDPIRRTVASSESLSWSIPMNYKKLRLGSFVSTGAPDAGDIITVTATLATLPGM